MAYKTESSHRAANSTYSFFGRKAAPTADARAFLRDGCTILQRCMASATLGLFFNRFTAPTVQCASSGTFRRLGFVSILKPVTSVELAAGIDSR